MKLPLQGRLALFLLKLNEAPKAHNAKEARDLVQTLLENIEDEFSGVANNLHSSQSRVDGRLYPPLDDSCKTHLEKGYIQCQTRRHYIFYGFNGAILITDFTKRIIFLEKEGSDGQNIRL